MVKRSRSAAVIVRSIDGMSVVCTRVAAADRQAVCERVGAQIATTALRGTSPGCCTDAAARTVSVSCFAALVD